MSKEFLGRLLSSIMEENLFVYENLTLRRLLWTLEVSVFIVNNEKAKKYIYSLSSEFASRQFENLLRRGYYGKALNVLKKFNRKD